MDSFVECSKPLGLQILVRVLQFTEGGGKGVMWFVFFFTSLNFLI